MNNESYTSQNNTTARYHHSEPITAQWQHDLLQNHLTSEVARRTVATTKLNAETLSRPQVMWRKLASGNGSDLILLPQGAQKSVSPRWAILFQGLSEQTTPPGIILASDVVIGMNRAPGSQPDLDLSQYDGQSKGVSRRHAMIRPSTRHLYLLDLQSTNGTCVNGLRTPPGIATVLQDGDLISFGALTFQLHILATPADFE